MQISFKVLGVRERPSESLRGVVQLISSDWDDYSFKTSFSATLYDLQGIRIDLGTVKIGYAGQLKGWTRTNLPDTFDNLPEGYFSLGQDVEYYKTAVSYLPTDDRSSILSALRDVVADESILVSAQNENVFKNSLMRSVSMSAIYGQFRRVLNGERRIGVRTQYSQEMKECLLRTLQSDIK